MSIHCYFGDFSSHTQELRMLDSFLNQLQLDWATENKWIYIIYNAIWDGQEIDMVCFTEHAIVVADFKNYTGKLGGKENGPWTMLTPSDEMIEVKGGNQLNPFVQIRKNKYVVMEWLNAQQFFSQDNLGFISGAIFFTELIEVNLALSNSVQKWLHVSDIPHASELFSHIHSPQIALTEVEVLALIERLNVTPHEWKHQAPQEIRYQPFKHPVQEDPLNTLTYVTATHDLTQEIEATKPVFVTQVILPLVMALVLSFVISGLYRQGAFNGVQDFMLQAVWQAFSKPKNHTTDVEDAEPETTQLVTQATQSKLKQAKLDQQTVSESPASNKVQSIKSDQAAHKALPISELSQFINADSKQNTIFGFVLGQSRYAEVSQQLTELKNVQANSFEGTVIASAINPKQILINGPAIEFERLKQVHFFFDQQHVLSAVRFSLNSAFEDQYKDTFYAQTQTLKRLKFEKLKGEVPHVGDMYATFKRKQDYVHVVQYHMGGFQVHVTFMTPSVYQKHIVVQELQASALF